MNGSVTIEVVYLFIPTFVSCGFCLQGEITLPSGLVQTVNEMVLLSFNFTVTREGVGLQNSGAPVKRQE